MPTVNLPLSGKSEKLSLNFFMSLGDGEKISPLKLTPIFLLILIQQLLESLQIIGSDVVTSKDPIPPDLA